MIQYDWASADAATMLAEILIPEVLGYHVVKDTQAGYGGPCAGVENMGFLGAMLSRLSTSMFVGQEVHSIHSVDGLLLDA